MSEPSVIAKPVIWIISTGTEILQGASVDRNSPWLSARLADLGLETARHMAIADRSADLRVALAQAAREADLAIVTGGLGPTADDLNRSILAELWGAELVEDSRALEMIRERFQRRGRELTDANRVQALIPAGAVTLYNLNGTAPGFYIRPGKGSGASARLLALPGPPREMQPMFNDSAATLIGQDFADCRVKLRAMLFHTCGIPESELNALILDLFESDPKVNVALLAKMSMVDIRLTLMGANDAENDRLAEQWSARLREIIGEQNIYGVDGQTLPDAIGRLLRERGQTLATAESCTGGMLAGWLTDVPGSSEYFLEGLVTYANTAKMARIGVPPHVIGEHGAVSEATARAMAQGTRELTGASWTVAVTGIAGPGGGTEERPVGLVYIGIAGPDALSVVRRFHFSGDRHDVRAQTIRIALDMLRRAIVGAPLTPTIAPRGV